MGIKKALSFCIGKREIYTTFSMKDQARAREVLSSHGIEYRVKTINRGSPSPAAAGSRARMGSFGSDLSQMYEYIIYVHKKDADQARHLLQPGR